MPNNAGNLNNLYAYFGWQGGTIHQIAEATGCDSDELIYTVPDQLDVIRMDSDYSAGQSALATCDKEFRVSVLTPKRKGNLLFWLGVRNGYAVM